MSEDYTVLLSCVAAIAIAFSLAARDEHIVATRVTPPDAASGVRPRDELIVHAEARSVQPGELVVLTVATLQPASGVSIRAFGREIAAYRIDPLTWRALVGIDLGVAPGTHTASIETGGGGRRLRANYRLEVQPRQFPVRKLSVDPAFVNPPADVQDRIAREAKELAALWSRSAGERLWSGSFLAPVPGVTASRFGARSVFNGEARSPHSGADFVSAAGTPVLAPNAGRVVLAEELYFSGNTVVVDHGLGLFSLFAHFSSVEVREGNEVQKGQEIGKVGATGRVTGPHLHWAVRVNGARVDPLAVLALLRDERPR